MTMDFQHRPSGKRSLFHGKSFGNIGRKILFNFKWQWRFLYDWYTRQNIKQACKCIEKWWKDLYLETLGLIFWNLWVDNYGSCEKRKRPPTKRKEMSTIVTTIKSSSLGTCSILKMKLDISLWMSHEFSFSRGSHINFTQSVKIDYLNSWIPSTSCSIRIHCPKI